ncbi:sodium:solute symporter [Arsukibacterium sp.]|uniref:sodium:solute symporter n=1 Tax=Arsukibacterium sp. TaxID=1977258 RepID=UPI001BD6C0A6|nr:sodium:solute symporter [Arsukibacterium sp.]
MPDFNLTLLDLLLILFYFALVLYIGIRVGAKNDGGTEDYFLAGRSMLWPFVGISLFASNISSTTLIGLSGDAYATGISVFNYEWMASVVLVFFAIFFLPLYLRSKVYTMPEFLERRFDARSRYYFSGLTLVGNILIDTAGALYAGGILLKLIFPEIPMWQSIMVLALLAGAYTIIGGLKAVIYTDAIQTVLILAGAIAVSVLAYQKIGSWDSVTAVTPDSMLSLVRPANDATMPWTGLLFGVPILGFYFWCTNQFMVQRVLSAKNSQHGRYGVLFAALLKLPVLFIMVLPGTMARVLYPDLPNPDMVYPTLLFDLLPIGVLGLVVAGTLAALMSSIDSTLNSASTLVTMDFVKKARPQLSDHKLMWVGRFTAFVFMVLAAAWAPYIESFGSLFKYLQTVLAYVAPPVVAVFIVGVFWRKATAMAAFSTFMVGLLASLWLLISPIQVHFLHVAALLFVICLLTMWLVSLITVARNSDEIADYIWTAQGYYEESLELATLRWYQNYRVLSVLLLFLTTSLVVWWW